MPKRIQRKRTKGWRMPEGAVYVGRGSKWGNPYRVGDSIVTARGGNTKIKDRQQAVDLFRRKFTNWAASYSAEIIRELRGHDLACWYPQVQLIPEARR